MKMNPRERKELAISEIAIVAFGIAGLVLVAWLAWFRPLEKSIATYQACVAAGGKVQQSYPQVCETKTGKKFTNPSQKAAQAQRQSQPSPTVSKTPYSKVPTALRQAIFDETKKSAPGCVKNGVIVDYSGQPADPAVAYQADEYAITITGCDGGALTFFGKNAAGAWQVLDRTQMGLSCDVIAKTKAIRQLFVEGTGNGTCNDPANNYLPRDIDTVQRQ